LQTEAVNSEIKPAAIVEIKSRSGRFSLSHLPLILALALVAITLGLYNPAARNDFINFDDNFYVTQNPHLPNGFTAANLHWAFLEFDAANWHPVTWLSHLLDYRMFGLKPAGHHFTSVSLHALNACLLFWLLFSATGAPWRSFWVALLFAVHPMNVESVAWVAERKNVLSTAFWLLTMLAYGWYARRPRILRYLVVVAMFALGLMSKPMLVTLPLVLLLWDYWPLKRITGFRSTQQRTDVIKLVLEKLPLLAMSLAASLITLEAQHSAESASPVLGLYFTFWNALLSYSKYLLKTIWPAKLAVFYPILVIHSWQMILSAAALLLISLLVWHFRSKRFLTTGWLWFLVALIPVIGIVQVGRQAMADRYAYVPLIGIFVMLVWSAAELRQKFSFSRRWIAVAIAAVLVLSFITRRQISYWHDNISLFSHALAVTDDNYLAHVNLGGALEAEGRSDEALEHFRAALAEYPQYGTAAFDIAVELQKRGWATEALKQYQASLPIITGDLKAPAYANMGVICYGLGRDKEAEQNFQNALAIDAGNFRSNWILGKILLKQGKFDAAVSRLQTAVRIHAIPDDLHDLGMALQAEGRRDQAELAFQEAARLQLNSEGSAVEVDTVAPKN
jgi:Flp pilus assembly protein TadD